MKILAIDRNHPLLIEGLQSNGHEVHEDYLSDYSSLQSKIDDYEGVIIRSRVPLDEEFLKKAPQLKFIARVGAGLENIDTTTAQSLNISIINASEGNRDSLAEHTVGMLLMLLHNLKIADQQVREGEWLREANRGDELMGKTVGLVGYGVQGKAFAQRLKGFGVRVICYDILDNVEDENAQQVQEEILKKEADILSLHTPLTELTIGMVNKDYIQSFEKSFYFLNTARGASVVTADLNDALANGKIKGAGLDVLEFEGSSFEKMQSENPEFQRLLSFPNVVLSPHIAGWSIQSKQKLAEIILEKINLFVAQNA